MLEGFSTVNSADVFLIVSLLGSESCRDRHRLGPIREVPSAAHSLPPKKTTGSLDHTCFHQNRMAGTFMFKQDLTRANIPQRMCDMDLL